MNFNTATQTHDDDVDAGVANHFSYLLSLSKTLQGAAWRPSSRKKLDACALTTEFYVEGWNQNGLDIYGKEEKRSFSLSLKSMTPLYIDEKSENHNNPAFIYKSSLPSSRFGSEIDRNCKKYVVSDALRR